jgi:hypothetical protein
MPAVPAVAVKVFLYSFLDYTDFIWGDYTDLKNDYTDFMRIRSVFLFVTGSFIFWW